MEAVGSELTVDTHVLIPIPIPTIPVDMTQEVMEVAVTEEVEEMVEVGVTDDNRRCDYLLPKRGSNRQTEIGNRSAGGDSGRDGAILNFRRLEWVKGVCLVWRCDFCHREAVIGDFVCCRQRDLSQA